jgi:hypothetical protein
MQPEYDWREKTGSQQREPLGKEKSAAYCFHAREHDGDDRNTRSETRRSVIQSASLGQGSSPHLGIDLCKPREQSMTYKNRGQNDAKQQWILQMPFNPANQRCGDDKTILGKVEILKPEESALLRRFRTSGSNGRRIAPARAADLDPPELARAGDGLRNCRRLYASRKGLFEIDPAVDCKR